MNDKGTWVRLLGGGITYWYLIKDGKIVAMEKI